MNFIAASFFYHASEVATFWTMIAFMDRLKLKEVFK